MCDNSDYDNEISMDGSFFIGMPRFNIRNYQISTLVKHPRPQGGEVKRIKKVPYPQQMTLQSYKLVCMCPLVSGGRLKG